MDLNEWSDRCHKLAKEKGFWEVSDNIPTKLMLVVTELGEACEADRHGDIDNFNEEIIDTFIRLFDLSGWCGIDINKEIEKKMKVNEVRPRLHGKKY